jgi:hypothetical protein
MDVKKIIWYKNIMKQAGSGGTSGAVWFFGFVGAAVYFLQTAQNFWGGILGILKALVWPAFFSI